MFSFEDKHLVVIGGSSGMGLATARAALELGASVVITGTNDSKVAEAARSLRDDRVSYGIVDVRDEGAVTQFFAEREQVDHVFVAAGATKLGNILDGVAKEQIDPIDLRLDGSVYVVRAAVPRMNGSGSFVFTGGLSTDRPVKGAWVSGIGTAAAEQLARVLALELAPIRFNAVSPGYVDTPMWDAIFGADRDAMLKQVGETMPLKRIVRPDEVACAVLFLMANEATTGEVLHVDAGARLV